MTTHFYSGPTDEQSSEPYCGIDVQESDCWPVDDRSISGTKDQLAPGLHPVIAIGGMTVADGRPLNLTGAVTTYEGTGSGTATDRVVVNIADGSTVRNYVANILTYSNGSAATYEQAPVVGQPVYVDDSADLAAGVTLSLSPQNSAGLRNPLAGYLMYCQDEIADGLAGGLRSVSTFDSSLSNSLVQQTYCVLQINAAREFAAPE